jgi:hypothetical protein
LRAGYFPESRSIILARRLILRGVDFMIRYSASLSTVRPTNKNALTEAVSPLEKEYRELLELRERVKKAEAAAKHLAQRDELNICALPVARVVSRRPITRRSGEFTKRQLYAMLAEAVRNTQ